MTLTVWPLRFSAQPAAMIDFFAALGLHQSVSHSSGGWAVFEGRAGRVGVHDTASADATKDSGSTSLNVMADDIEAAADELRAAGLTVRVWDETYGKQGVVESPDGFAVGLNAATQEDLYGGYQQHDRLLGQDVAASMSLVAICSVADVEQEAEFWARLGFTAIEPGEGYLPLTAGDTSGVIGLRVDGQTHDDARATDQDQLRPPYLVSLGAETSEPLDALADRMRAAGHPADVVEDDSGVWVRVTDPDGRPFEVRPTR